MGTLDPIAPHQSLPVLILPIKLISCFSQQVSILNLEDRVSHDTKSVMQDTSLDILQTIVKYSPKPLSPVLVNTAFPATVHCILRTDDHATMQSGGECLRAFINGKIS